MKTVIGITKEYEGLTEIAHKDALEWCKACIQKRIDHDHLEDQVDWEDLIVKDEKIDEYGWYRMECRLPLKELFF
jgi:hypothetical protein